MPCSLAFISVLFNNILTRYDHGKSYVRKENKKHEHFKDFMESHEDGRDMGHAKAIC